MKPIKLIEYDQADAEKGGTDIMESFIETPPHNGCMVIIKNKDNLGFAAGNNVALRYAIKRNIPFIMLLNNDTVVTPDFLTCLTKDLINNSQWMAIGPKILYHNNPQYIWYAGAQINLSQIAVKHLGYNQIDSNHWTDIKPTDHISACCILARNKLFKLIGLFDEEYFFIHEDWDFSCRVKKNGLKLAVDLNAVVYHKVGGSINNRKGNLKNIYFSNKNRLLLMKKNASTKEMIRGFGYYTLSRFVKFLSLTLHLKISQLFIEIKSIRDFFSGYFGIFDRNNASSVNQHNIKLN
jgi:GT2 family glycosyltransferase